MASTLAKRLIRHEGVAPAEELSDESLLEQFLSGLMDEQGGAELSPRMILLIAAAPRNGLSSIGG